MHWTSILYQEVSSKRREIRGRFDTRGFRMRSRGEKVNEKVIHTYNSVAAILQRG